MGTDGAAWLRQTARYSPCSSLLPTCQGSHLLPLPYCLTPLSVLLVRSISLPYVLTLALSARPFLFRNPMLRLSIRNTPVSSVSPLARVFLVFLSSSSFSLRSRLVRMIVSLPARPSLFRSTRRQTSCSRRGCFPVARRISGGDGGQEWQGAEGCIRASDPRQPVASARLANFPIIFDVGLVRFDPLGDSACEPRIFRAWLAEPLFYLCLPCRHPDLQPIFEVTSLRPHPNLVGSVSPAGKTALISRLWRRSAITRSTRWP